MKYVEKGYIYKQWHELLCGQTLIVVQRLIWSHFKKSAHLQPIVTGTMAMVLERVEHGGVGIPILDCVILNLGWDPSDRFKEVGERACTPLFYSNPPPLNTNRNFIRAQFVG